MSWNSPMEVHYQNHSMPYNSIGSFVDFFGGLTYDHVNYIFADANYVQEYSFCKCWAIDLFNFHASSLGWAWLAWCLLQMSWKCERTRLIISTGSGTVLTLLDLVLLTFKAPIENAYNAYPATNTSSYKFAVSEPGSFSYYEYGNGYVVDNHIPETDEYSGHVENPSVVADDQATVSHVHQEGNSSSTSHARPIECPRNHQDARDNEVVWQDSIDPDNMTYEELLELGEAVGTQSRGLSQDQIALLPTSKFKCGLFSRKKFRGERCVICQMDYKRGDRRMTLPCKHLYHSGCGSRWLSINKACPICYKEVIVDVPKH